MNTRNPLHEQQLERLTHQALRQLPQCAAPASLEARVLSEIDRRAAVRLRGAGISRWPAALRALLIAVCALSVPLVWMLIARVRGHMSRALAGSGFEQLVHGVSSTSHTVLSLGELAARLAHLIPKEWLLGGLFIVGAVYAVLIAFGYLLLHPTLANSKAHTI
jgi:hypothetical protein